VSAQSNAACSRSREYLRPDEVERIISAVKSIGRHKVRDTQLILMMFRHGLRVNEALDLKWTDIDWVTAHVHIKRLKQGSPSVQPIDGKEMRLLRKVERSHICVTLTLYLASLRKS
jgi:integrase